MSIITYHRKRPVYISSKRYEDETGIRTIPFCVTSGTLSPSYKQKREKRKPGRTERTKEDETIEVKRKRQITKEINEGMNQSKSEGKKGERNSK